MSSGSLSQVGGSLGSMQGSSQGSPLMDNLHGTSTSTSTDSCMRLVDRPSGVQAFDDDEDSFTLVGEVCSGKRKSKWFQDTLREATSVTGPKR